MEFARLAFVTEAFADRSGDHFGLSFRLEKVEPLSNFQAISLVLDRPTLERLQHQIAFALSPQTPPARDLSE